MTHKCCTFTRVVILISLCVSIFFGCTDPPDDKILTPEEPTLEEFSITTVAVKNFGEFQEETFSELKTEFGRNLLDDNFKILRLLTHSETYLGYLEHAFPTDEPFQTFDEFISMISPADEGYRPFLERYFQNINEDDILAMDILIGALLRGNFRAYQGGNKVTFFASRADAWKHPIVKEWIEQRFEVEKGPIDAQKFNNFTKSSETFSKKIDTAYAKLVQDYFNAHGENEGIIWFALQEPLRLERILDNFTKAKVFREWVNGDFKDFDPIRDLPDPEPPVFQ